MKINKEFVLREIAGDYVLVPIGKTAGEYNGLFPLTETAADIWKMLPDVQTRDEITEKLLEDYDVDRATLENDIDEFLDKLREFGIVD